MSQLVDGGTPIRALPVLPPIGERDIPWWWGPWLVKSGSAGERATGGVDAPPSAPDAVRALYLRPDVRTAVTALTPAFADLLSKDEDATRAFNQLVNMQGGGERILPILLGILAVELGVAIGIWSRP
jgi:hypothetical protein